MANASTDQMEMILRECVAALPQPWYPSAYVRATGIARETLDTSLDHLRLGGLVRLTDWVQGSGQGYTLTPEGQQVLEDPRLLRNLRTGGVPAAKVEVPAGPRPDDERPPGWARADAVRDALLQPTRPVVTYTLLALNVLVFLVGFGLALQRGIPWDDYMVFSQADLRLPEVLDLIGALNRRSLLEGQWWRLLTCCFVHFGFLHLAVNMYALFSMGVLLERMWGSLRFLLLYLVTGFAGSCAAMIYTPEAWLAGASGALCGILASMLVWVLLNRPYLPPALASSWMRGIMTNIILIVCISMIPGISAPAHFGGGTAGLLAAVPLTWSRFGQGGQRWLGLLGVLLIPVVAFAVLERSLPRTEQDREVANLQATFLRPFARTFNAKKEAATVLDPLLSQGARGKSVDPAQAQEARRKADEARAAFRDLADQLSEARPYEDAAARQALTFLKEYAEGWATFFELFDQAMDDQGHWHFNEEAGPSFQALSGQLGRAQRAEKNVKDSVLIPPGNQQQQQPQHQHPKKT